MVWPFKDDHNNSSPFDAFPDLAESGINVIFIFMDVIVKKMWHDEVVCRKAATGRSNCWALTDNDKTKPTKKGVIFLQQKLELRLQTG